MIRTGWGKHPVSENDIHYWQCDQLRIAYQLKTEELWLAHLYMEPGSELSEEDIENLKWQRWALSGTLAELNFAPATPDLPIVIKPEYPFWLTPGVKTQIHSRLPLWVQIYLHKDMVIEIPVIPISKTWFGDFFSGDICYEIISSVRKVIQADLERPQLGICPIQIINEAEEALLVEKICLHVGQLSLFNAEGQLWTNTMRVRYRGANDVSEIEVLKKPPKEVSQAKAIAEAREANSKSITAKTFASIKEFTGLRFL